MPAFIKTPADEKRWSKAKEAANKGHSESEGDSYWKIVNHIYQQMGKTEDLGKSVRDFFEKSRAAGDTATLDELQSFLEKARARLAEEPSEEDTDPGDYSPEQGFHEYDPETEGDEADKWLQENDPEKQDDNEEDSSYDEYDPNEDEDAHIKAAGFDPQIDQEDPEADAEDTADEPPAPPQKPAAQVEQPKPEGRFPQPTKEDIAEMRQYTRPWEQRAREKTRLEAEAHKNPVLHHEGRLVEARNLGHKSRQDAYAAFQTSPEYQNADPISQMEMDAKFHEDWHKNNPEYLQNAVKLHGEAHDKGRKAKDVHAAAKDAQIQHIISGGARSEDAVSTEEGMQHAGGAKGEEGTVGAMAEDPASSFAAGHQDFLRQYAKDYEKKAKKPQDLEDMMNYDDKSRSDVARVLGDHPALKDPNKKAGVDKFFAKYHPLIAMNAHKVLNKMGLDHKKGDVDLGMLHEAGMHGLFQAINDYDHDHPSKASFSTHAGNKIRGLMQTALRSQDQIPQEIRAKAKKFQQQKQAPVTVTTMPKATEQPKTKAVGELIGKHPSEVADRLKRIQTFRQVHMPKVPKPEGGDNNEGM